MANPRLCSPFELAGFLKSFLGLIEPGQIDQVARDHHSGRGRPARLKAHQVIMALVYHLLEPQGYFSAHFTRLWNQRVSDATLSKRRRVMGFKVFEELLESVLRPLADAQAQPECFYRGLRLMGIDGTEFSVPNTPTLLGQITKAASRRFESAFGKLGMCVLVELGSHNPVGAAIGEKGSCELALSRQLWTKLPQACLLIADRLYGTAFEICGLLKLLGTRDSHVLIRMRKNLKTRVLQRFEDGSALVELEVHDRLKPREVVGRLRLREIRGRIKKPGATQWSEVRLMTSLLDSRLFAAKELFELYARRWEQELYYKQLKLELRGGELLQSHTLETAMQELAALVMASALIARARIEAGQQVGVEVARVSFSKLLYHVRCLWSVLAAGADVLTAPQRETMARNYLHSVSRECILKPRRSRSCPRTVRQPVRKWPRTQHALSCEGNFDIQLVNINDI
jgi:hypothetical protein